MPLIKCPDCGNEVSSSAKTCIHCGAPLKAEEVGPVKIKTPFFQNQYAINKNNATLVIKNNDEILWEGFAEETASFKVEKDTNIEICLKDAPKKLNAIQIILCILLWFVLIGIILFIVFMSKKEDRCFLKGTVKPGKKYECKLVNRAAVYLNSTWKLSEVDTIDSKD